MTLDQSSLTGSLEARENREKENAREMWKSFVALNIVCKYWVNKANKWVLARSS